MIIYLHGFDSNSPGNHEKVLQPAVHRPGCQAD